MKSATRKVLSTQHRIDYVDHGDGTITIHRYLRDDTTNQEPLAFKGLYSEIDNKFVLSAIRIGKDDGFYDIKDGGEFYVRNAKPIAEY